MITNKDEIIDAEYEFIDSTEEENKALVEALIIRMKRIRDGKQDTSVSQHAYRRQGSV